MLEGNKEIYRKSIDVNDSNLAIDQLIYTLGSVITDVVDEVKKEISSSHRLKQIFIIKNLKTVSSFNFICTKEVQAFIDNKFTKLNSNEEETHYYSEPYFISIKDKGIILNTGIDKNVVADPKAIINLLSNYC